jgi:hypothetical protein
METILTPVVSRLLRSFIKSADGEEGASLRVTFTRGCLVLHNLELNLVPLLGTLADVGVKRAFARELRIEIPWTSLGYKPIEVR